MLENIANGYARYVKLDAYNDLVPIRDTIDELQTRLEEFESLIKMVEREGQEVSSVTFSKIYECFGEIDVLKRRIDNLQLFVDKVHGDLVLVEKQVETAEMQIGVPDNKLKSLFKPLLNKISKEFPSNQNEGRPDNLNFVAPVTFKTSDYFPENELNDDPANT